MSIFDGVSRPLRAAGLGLLAVAVVAAAIGGVTLVSGEDTENTAATAPAEPGGEDKRDEKSKAPAPGDGGDESDGGDEGSTGEDEADSDDTDGSGGAEDKPVSDESVPVRVYNNSTIKGLASRAGDDLGSLGWDVVETGNYSAGVIPRSTIYYRPGTEEEAVAHSLGETFGMRVEPRFDGIADASPGLIMIVTKDYAGPDTTK
ncbi:LytR C-terminal domain-containing protein [Saccharomonospora sp. NB11]|jgi:hypothetical protein|uniref:LytR C-terminal domain-containing protein n=1 Tax=Saccharomonospora sp. NB11 TaxID=1642298 RepID=UPI0018D133A0|nr:LytR C-terminal domain-containing protein [Saccharomonospora sp. NB11]